MRTISTYGASIAGIQPVNGKTGASQRSRPRDFDEGRDSEGGDSADAEPDAPPQPPGIGRLVDKIV